MNTRRFSSLITPIILAILTSALLIACQSNPPKESSLIVEVYEVAAGANTDYARGSLKYKEIENYLEGRMTEKIFYNGDGTIRGKEIYAFDHDALFPNGSKYYDANGVVLSRYRFHYQDSLKVRAEAYEGEYGELLRLEVFEYDDNGNLTKKMINNNIDETQKSFVFDHDSFGNEIKMTLLDANDNRVLTESYEITNKLENGEWKEKWGYLNNEKTPTTFYNKKLSQPK